jgi:hypothetical protein
MVQPPPAPPPAQRPAALDDGDRSPASSCCGPAARCVFGKAMLAQSATCERAERRAEGEQLHVVCTSPVAHTNCGTLAALLQERSRFALRLPAPGRPLMHAQALRLQCGGLAALHRVLGDEGGRDAHRAVVAAQQRYGSLADLPWAELVASLVAWQPPRRHRGG